jgi:hypothetical protein
MELKEILVRATNEELKKLYYSIFMMEYNDDWTDFSEEVSKAFEDEVRKRLNNGTMKNELSSFPTDWEIFVSNCL